MNGSTIFVKKELHGQIGGFNEDIEIGEDIDYSQRLARTNAKGLFVPAKMYLSNRRLVNGGRINMVLIALNWNSLLPKPIGRFVNRNYFINARRLPFWRKTIRIIINVTMFTFIASLFVKKFS